MPILRSGEAALRLCVPVGDALTVTAAPGSSASVVSASDLNPAATVSGAAQSFGPYASTKMLTLTCTAGAVSFDVRDASLAVVEDPATAKLYAGGAELAEINSLVSGYRIVYQNNAIVQSSDTGVATANALASFVLPGGSMGPNGWLRFTMIMKGIDAINAAKNTRLWANSTRIFENGTTTTAGVVQYQFNWFNSNSESAQTSFYKDQLAYGTTGATAGSSAINTAQDITFYLTGDSASAAGPTIQKCAFMVELLRG